MAAAIWLTACGDDSSGSSSENESSEKYFLDEENQNFGITRGLCYISEGTTRWDEDVYTTYYHYEIKGDYLVLFHAGSSADNDGKIVTKFDEDRYSAIFKSVKHNGVFGEWEEVNCIIDDGNVNCEDVKEDSEGSTVISLKVSNSNIEFAWKINDDYCPTDYEEFDYFFEDILEDAEVSTSSVKCNSAKVKVAGISLNIDIDVSIDNDNVMVTTTNVSNGKIICSYTEKSVNELVRYPSSVCNINDMEYYVTKYTSKEKNRYVYEYTRGEVGYSEYTACLENIFVGED